MLVVVKAKVNTKKNSKELSNTFYTIKWIRHMKLLRDVACGRPAP